MEKFYLLNIPIKDLYIKIEQFQTDSVKIVLMISNIVETVIF